MGMSKEECSLVILAVCAARLLTLRLQPDVLIHSTKNVETYPSLETAPVGFY